MQPDRIHTLLLNLSAFSQTGGVEKVSRFLAKVSYEIAQETHTNFCNLSLYDSQPDSRYCPEKTYVGYVGNKFQFVLKAIKIGKGIDKLILTHINLTIVALLIKLINPKVKIFLFAHGIEIWRSLSFWKRYLLKKTNCVIAVSSYTKQRLLQRYPELDGRIKVLNNCLDPFFDFPTAFNKPLDLQKRYGVEENEKVILTLCRLSSSEQYKGYDWVIKSLKKIPGFSNWKYLLMGKYDKTEYERILKIIKEQNLEEKIILTGFIPDEEIINHFLLGDIFIMPSTDEGFGLVFIEAAACGLSLIAGNIDGSSDALLNGKLGQLVNPASAEEISKALMAGFQNKQSGKEIQQICLNHFHSNGYKTSFKQILSA